MEDWFSSIPRETLGWALGFVTGCAMPTISRVGIALGNLLRLLVRR